MNTLSPALPTSDPRSVSFETQATDGDFSTYSARIQTAINAGIPGLLKKCEWHDLVFTKAWNISEAPADYKRREPLAYIRQGTESAIVCLALKSWEDNTLINIWTAKIFDDDAALEMLIWFTKSINWMKTTTPPAP